MWSKKEITVLSGFTWFLIVLGKIQDGDHIWWCHSLPAAPPPIKYTSFCWEDQKLSTEGKIVSKCWNIKIENGGGNDFTWTSEGWYWVTGKTKHKANKPPICPETQIHVFYQKEWMFIAKSRQFWHYCYMFKNLTNFKKNNNNIKREEFHSIKLAARKLSL